MLWTAPKQVLMRLVAFHFTMGIQLRPNTTKLPSAGTAKRQKMLTSATGLVGMETKSIVPLTKLAET
jgi:hypothetical protein